MEETMHSLCPDVWLFLVIEKRYARSTRWYGYGKIITHLPRERRDARAMVRRAYDPHRLRFIFPCDKCGSKASCYSKSDKRLPPSNWHSARKQLMSRLRRKRLRELLADLK